MTAPDQGAFWRWSLEHYARRGVEHKLLRLQDAFGLNVNIALWTCWSATRFEPLTDAHLRNAMELTAAWSERITKPLRKVRRSLAEPEAADAAALRGQLKDAELQAEKVEQDMLEALAFEWLQPLCAVEDVPHDRARKNLSTYGRLGGGALAAGELSSLLESLAGHIFEQPAPGD